MAFWTNDFLSWKRKQWQDSIHRFEYQVNGVWYEAKINSKKIVGNTITFLVSLQSVPNTTHTITGVRLWDITGKVCGQIAVSVKRTAGQGVLAKFEFPLYEKGDV